MFSIWFMFDNHLFKKIDSNDRSEIAAKAKALFERDGCGSVFVHDQWGVSIDELILHGHFLPTGKWGVTAAEIEAWADKAICEMSFQRAMCA